MAPQMATTDRQTELFPAQSPRVYSLADASLVEYLDVFSEEKTKYYFAYLLENIDWQKATIRIAGRCIPIPRLQCWVADADMPYTYSGISMLPEP